MHLTFLSSLSHLLKSHLKTHFPALPASQIHDIIFPRIKASLDATTNMDAFPRMMKVLESSTTPLLDFILSASPSQAHLTSQIPKFRKSVAQEAAQILQQTRSDYILGKMGPAPAANLLGGARPLYEFVRIELGVRMHGRDNLRKFEGERDRGVGESVSIINEAIKDGRMAQTVADVIGQFVKEKKSDLGERFWARL
jgi:phenylalanine ammonia-lyase